MPADCRYVPGIHLVDPEPRRRGLGALFEQAYGVVMIQRLEPVDSLSRHAESHPACGEDSDIGTRLQNLASHCSHCRHKVLAVVDHKLSRPLPQVFAHCLEAIRCSPVES